MQISSPAFENEGSIPSKYTCDGENISPPLLFVDVPKEAQGLVLLMDDPDVPKSVREDQMWDHWVIFNIPPTITEIAEGQNPTGTLGMNTGGRQDYGSPCPPDREHRYYFRLYALDTQLDLAPGSTKDQVETAMEGHIVASAELMGRYNRI